MSSSSNGASQSSAPQDGVPLDDPRSLLRVYPFATYTPTARGRLMYSSIVTGAQAEMYSRRAFLPAYQNIPISTNPFLLISSTCYSIQPFR
jgi:hypothetical protein